MARTNYCAVVMVKEPRVGQRPNHSPGRRILVVDDIADVADTLAMLLTATGHQTQVAYDGPNAITAVRAFRPEVVLLDIGLPGMSGLEVARHLRREPKGSKLLVVAVTGYDQAEDRLQSKEAGFDHHLVKPVSPQALEELLGHLAIA